MPPVADIQKRIVPYAEAVRELRDGDLLLMPWTPGVSAATKSDYGHGSMLWRGPGGEWLLTEMSLWGVTFPLETRVQWMPGKCDVWRPRWQINLPYYPYPASEIAERQQRAVAEAIRQTKLPFGLLHTAAIVASAFPIVNMLWSGQWDREAPPGSPPHCMEMLCRACKAGGVDLVENLADRWCGPGDVIRGGKVDYILTCGL